MRKYYIINRVNEIVLKVVLIVFVLLGSNMSNAVEGHKIQKDNQKTVFAALENEITQQPLTVQGKIPDWLSGTFVRNGPIPVHSTKQNIKIHRFDGPAMLHAFSFQNGTVTYSNKFLRTDVYRKIFEEQDLNYSGFANESESQKSDLKKSELPKNSKQSENSKNLTVSQTSKEESYAKKIAASKMATSKIAAASKIAAPQKTLPTTQAPASFWGKIKGLFKNTADDTTTDNADTAEKAEDRQEISNTQDALQKDVQQTSLQNAEEFSEDKSRDTSESSNTKTKTSTKLSKAKEAVEQSDRQSDEHPSMPNANVNVVEIANQPVALTETPLPIHFDLKNLDTLGPLIFQDKLPQKDIFESAHPQTDKIKVEKINYLIEFGRKTKYVIYKYHNEVPKRETITEIEVEKPAYMHSFALTNQYVILVEFPLLVNPIDLLNSSKGYINHFRWQPEQGTRFLIVDRKTGKLIKTIKDSKAFFAFHHVNAFEKGEDIILDIISYPDSKVILADATSSGEVELKPNEQPKLMRYTLSIKNDSVKASELFDVPVEFPRVNENYNTKAYRYVYLVDDRSLKHNNHVKPIYKVDTIQQGKKSWQEPNAIPGEPVFIPEPSASEEDKGVVVSIVLNEKDNTAFLLILDAKTMREMARIYAPHSIPTGLHGQFFHLNLPRL